MSGEGMSTDTTITNGRSLNLARALFPLILLAGLLGLFLATDPLKPLGVVAPPVEDLTFERTTLDDAGITMRVRAAGSEPLRIAQVQVDGAFWRFDLEPAGPLGRLETADLHIPYPWVQDEAHFITVLTSTGAAFDHEIEVATATPKPTLARILAYALLGIYVGVVPVTLGLLFYPYLRTLGKHGLSFLLALTVGLLAFLLVDTLEEGLEIAAGAAGALQASATVWLAAALSFLTLLAIGRRHGVPAGLALAWFLALGIGLHNLGEGLAIGAAFAIGQAALGSFLVIGFTLHNVTEGVGIAATITRQRIPLRAFAGLAALAGLPAVAGTWIGAFAFAPHWAALFLAIGAGAILQVMVELGAYLARSAAQRGSSPLSAASLAGFATGLAVMDLTGLLLPA
jgi:ZIP family zinc transporter